MFPYVPHDEPSTNHIIDSIIIRMVFVNHLMTALNDRLATSEIEMENLRTEKTGMPLLNCTHVQ